MTAIRWRFLAQFAVALLGVLAMNALVGRLGKTTVARRLLLSLEQPSRVDGIAIGNSLIEAGFDAQIFDRATGQPVHFINAGLGSTDPVEHLLLLRHAITHHPEAKTVIYGFFDLQLTAQPTGGWNDLVGNRALAYYVEPYLPRTFIRLGRRGLVDG